MDRAVINEANLRNAILARAILTRSDLGGADVEGADFTNALIDRTQQLVRKRIMEVSCSEVYLVGGPESVH